MDNTVYFLYEILKSDYPIPEGRAEEALQAFAMGLDFGLSLGLELSPFQEDASTVTSAVTASAAASRS